MKNKNEITQILSEMKESGVPVGATYLTSKLSMPPATIGRLLLKMEKEGLVERISNKGRRITQSGITYLESQNTLMQKYKTADKLINMTEDVSKNQLLEILEIRKFLEGRSAELSSINATEEQFKELDRIVLKHMVEIRHGGLGNEEDLELHLKIAEYSGHTTIHQILKLLLTRENTYTKFSTASIPDLKHAQLKQHADLVDAIKSRDPVKAHMAMEDHLNQVISDVKEFYPESRV